MCNSLAIENVRLKRSDITDFINCTVFYNGHKNYIFYRIFMENRAKLQAFIRTCQ